jgi:N-acyl-D-amino-acid deacylase
MPGRYDTLIRDALVHDGTGAAPVTADVALDGERIALVGDAGGAAAATEIDAQALGGLALAPGFIDVHTHDDFAALLHPEMTFKTLGGVTTCIVGNCGFGAAPFPAASKILEELVPAAAIPSYEGHAGYARAAEAAGLGANIGVLAGHGTIRLAAMGTDDRAPTDAEMAGMKSHLREALDAGVFGLSTGLIYEPGCHAATDEIAELAGEMRGTGALYATHMRDEGSGLLTAVGEAIEIGARAGVPVQISHHKAAGRDNWGLVNDSLRLIEQAQARGEDVHADQYPYTAGSTMLRAVLRNGAFTGSPTGDPGIASVLPEDVVIASAPGREDWEGQSVEALAAAFGLPPRAAAERIVAEVPGASVVLHMMSEADVQTVLCHHSTMIGSDGIPTLDGKPHPRLYNSFARVLGHYARDEGLMPMETAIYRMTGMSARKFGLTDRGAIRAGAFADLVLFDPATVIDTGTYDEPNRYPAGIAGVFVNGRQVVQNGRPTDARPGQLLRRAPA